MKAISIIQAIGLLVSGFFADTALAIPPTDVPTFTKASISIEARGDDAGSLNCSFREEGLGSFTTISYTCNAAAAAVAIGCFDNNKWDQNALVAVSDGRDMSSEDDFLSSKKGKTASTIILTAPPTLNPCAGSLKPKIITARWCNMSLADTTNNLVGATLVELFQIFTDGAPTVPSCADLLLSPP